MPDAPLATKKYAPLRFENSKKLTKKYKSEKTIFFENHKN
jgi:hypothetical protein